LSSPARRVPTQGIARPGSGQACARKPRAREDAQAHAAHLRGPQWAVRSRSACRLVSRSWDCSWPCSSRQCCQYPGAPAWRWRRTCSRPCGVPLIISGLPQQELTFLHRSFTGRGAMGRRLVQAKLASSGQGNAEARGYQSAHQTLRNIVSSLRIQTNALVQTNFTSWDGSTVRAPRTCTAEAAPHNDVNAFHGY